MNYLMIILKCISDIFSDLKDEAYSYIKNNKMAIIVLVFSNFLCFIFSVGMYLNRSCLSIYNFLEIDSFVISIFFVVLIFLSIFLHLILAVGIFDVFDDFRESFAKKNKSLYIKIKELNPESSDNARKKSEIMKNWFYKKEIFKTYTLFGCFLFIYFVFYIFLGTEDANSVTQFVGYWFFATLVILYLALCFHSNTYMGWLVNMFYCLSFFLLFYGILGDEKGPVIGGYKINYMFLMTLLMSCVFTFFAISGQILNFVFRDRQIATVLVFFFAIIFCYYRILISLVFLFLGLRNPEVDVVERESHELVISGELLFRTQHELFLRDPEDSDRIIVYKTKTNYVAGQKKVHGWPIP